jgi:hypothetical protein
MIQPEQGGQAPEQEPAEASRKVDRALEKRWEREGPEAGARRGPARRPDPVEPHEFMGLPERTRERRLGHRVRVSPGGLALGQGLYFAATGLWSLVDIRSFQRVTGPKTDLWLVKTVGVLVTVIGSVLTQAALRGAVSPEVKALALGSAVGLGGVDVVYTLKRQISPIYLLDALLEAALTAGWLRLGTSAGGPPRRAAVRG